MNQESVRMNETRNAEIANRYQNSNSRSSKSRRTQPNIERKGVKVVKNMSVPKNTNFTPLKSLSPYTSVSRQDYDSKNFISRGKATSEHYQPTFENVHCQRLLTDHEVRDPNNSFIKKKL